mgnify:CR=1 FL=1
MAKNQIQFQQGYNLFEFMEDYCTEKSAKRHCLSGAFLTGISAIVVVTKPTHNLSAVNYCNATDVLISIR